MGVRAVTVGALVGALALAPSAAADESLHSSGSLVYAWHGDPARGCAQVGVCSVRGTVIVQPQGGADLGEVTKVGGLLAFDGLSSTVRVRSGDAGTCVDQAGGAGPDLGLLNLTWTTSGSVSASLPGSLSSGRCAGPGPAELNRVPITGRRSGGRHPGFDFRRVLPFTAGPYSGTLNSTLVLAPDAGSGSGSNAGSFFGGGSSSSSGWSGASGGVKLHKIMREEVVLRYRISTAATVLQIAFVGENGPFCAVLDACGARGTLSLALPARRGSLELVAAKRVSRPVSRRQALADFRAGRLPFVGGAANVAILARWDERYSGPQSSACTDAGATQPLDFAFASARRAVSVKLVGLSETDVLRTHCPGPELVDVIGNAQTLARGAASRRMLTAEGSNLTLTGGAAFSGLGYAGSRSARVAISLRRLTTVAGTRTGTAP